MTDCADLILSVYGLFIVLIELIHAPEGYEDGSGFHFRVEKRAESRGREARGGRNVPHNSARDFFFLALNYERCVVGAWAILITAFVIYLLVKMHSSR